MIKLRKAEFDVAGFEYFAKQIAFQVDYAVQNAVFEQETWQTLRIFEDKLWKAFALIPEYRDHEVRLSFGIANDTRVISGSVFVRQIGFDYFKKVDFSSIR
jgi:hypothetical protein